jgi:NTP pyrophosphatase (non-canonical NTP hydrolase)
VNLKELAQEARQNSERWFGAVHDDDQALVPLACHYTLGMVGEAGEVANVVKKWLRHPETASLGQLGEDLELELADVFIYLLLLADEVGVDLEAAYAKKRDINEGRWG